MPTAVTLQSSVSARVGQLVRLLASDRSGEVISAAAAIVRTLAHAGADIHTLADIVERGLQRRTPEPSRPHHQEPRDYLALARRCWCRRHELAEHERRFVLSMMEWRGEPTERQAAWLLAIAHRLQGGHR
jgi:hypothetical protein